MTHTDAIRRAALQESRSLRGYARYGWRVPRYSPIDRWDEYQRASHTNGATFKAAA